MNLGYRWFLLQRVWLFLCLCLSSLTTQAQSTIAHYPFDGNANDESGNGQYGVEHGGIIYAADRFAEGSSAISLDGIYDWVAFGTLEGIE